MLSDGRAARADDAADEPHVGAVRVVGVARRRPWGTRRTETTASCCATHRCSRRAARCGPCSRSLKSCVSSTYALLRVLPRHDRVEAAEIELAEADRNRAYRGSARRPRCSVRPSDPARRSRAQSWSANTGGCAPGTAGRPSCRLDEVGDAVQVAVERGGPDGLKRGVARQRRDQERAGIAGLAQVVGRAREPAVVGRERVAVEMVKADEQMRCGRCRRHRGR